MKKLIPLLLVLAAFLTLPACGKTPEPAPTQPDITTASTIKPDSTTDYNSTTASTTQPDITTAYTTKSFGGYTWRVLDEQDGKVLLITEDIIEQRPYNAAAEDVTWETCTLRTYLNGEFYSKFSAQEQAMILETRNTNPDNQWYGTDGGNDTMDRVFLLSVEEVVKYFGDSGDLAARKGWYWEDGKVLKDGKGYYISDQYNSERAAKFNNGDVGLSGSDVNIEFGVRPALWLKL